MRLTQILLRARARTPQDINKVSFVKPRLGLKLRTFVTGKTNRVKEVTGLEELGLLFAAMKAHDFNEKYCQQEINKVRTVFVEAKKQRDETKRIANSGGVKIGRDLHFLQLNRYLKKFPEPKKN